MIKNNGIVIRWPKYSKPYFSIPIRSSLESCFVDSEIVGVKNREKFKENIFCLDWNFNKEYIYLLSRGNLNYNFYYKFSKDLITVLIIKSCWSSFK